MQKTIQQIYDLFPDELKQATIFKDLLNPNIILYNFGEPLSIEGKNVHSFGTVENQELRILYLSIFLADKFLSQKQRDEWLNKISDKKKHSDFLFEMRPLMRLKASSIIEYETTENCEGNKNVDWKIQNGDSTVLFEVKNRIKPAINYFGDLVKLASEHNQGKKISPIAPPSNTDNLFESVVGKFKNQSDENVLQGVWINTCIKEDQEKLQKYFDTELDSKKIQFAIFSGWDNQSNILVKEEFQREVLMNLFGLTEEEREVVLKT